MTLPINPISGMILGNPNFNKYIWSNIQGQYLVLTFYDPVENRYYTRKILNNNNEYKR